MIKQHQAGTGNVFQDLGFPNADEHMVKPQLVYKIDTILKSRGLKQVQAGKLFAPLKSCTGNTA